jgi:hypothetical protein
VEEKLKTTKESRLLWSSGWNREQVQEGKKNQSKWGGEVEEIDRKASFPASHKQISRSGMVTG